MIKWADYLITAVRYDGNKEYITKVKISEDNDEDKLNFQIQDRTFVVELLKNKKNIITAPKNKDNKLTKGEKVNIYNTKWIRTNPNNEEKDNLGELPEFLGQ